MKEKYCDTNPKVVLLMIERLMLPDKLPAGFKFLEPQAGNGVIIELLPIAKSYIADHVDFCELNARKATVTAEKTGAVMREFDFFSLPPKFIYDRIISVPPFEDKLWKDHTAKMYTHLKSGGKMVVLLPEECMKDADFINWCLQRSCHFTPIDLCACSYECSTGILEILK